MTDYTPVAERLLIAPRRGRPTAAGKRMGQPLHRAATVPLDPADNAGRVRLIADVVIDDMGLRRVISVQHHATADREARLIEASEQPMPDAEKHRAQLVARLGHPQWAVLHSALSDLEHTARRRTPHGRIRCEIYAVGEKG